MLGAACPVKRAFIPMAGLARFENIDRVCANASAGAQASAASRYASMRNVVRTEPVMGRPPGASPGAVGAAIDRKETLPLAAKVVAAAHPVAVTTAGAWLALQIAQA